MHSKEKWVKGTLQQNKNRIQETDTVGRETPPWQPEPPEVAGKPEKTLRGPSQTFPCPGQGFCDVESHVLPSPVTPRGSAVKYVYIITTL